MVYLLAISPSIIGVNIISITPQFENTHINFHRIPLVDTSNPFSGQAVPAPEDSLVVTSVRIDGVDLQAVADKLPAEAMAFLQNDTTLVYKGSFMVDVMDIMLTPIIDGLMANK